MRGGRPRDRRRRRPAPARARRRARAARRARGEIAGAAAPEPASARRRRAAGASSGARCAASCAAPTPTDRGACRATDARHGVGRAPRSLRREAVSEAGAAAGAGGAIPDQGLHATNRRRRATAGHAAGRVAGRRRSVPGADRRRQALWIGAVEDEIADAQRSGPRCRCCWPSSRRPTGCWRSSPQTAGATFGRFAQAVRGAVRRQDILVCETESPGLDHRHATQRRSGPRRWPSASPMRSGRAAVARRADDRQRRRGRARRGRLDPES